MLGGLAEAAGDADRFRDSCVATQLKFTRVADFTANNEVGLLKLLKLDGNELRAGNPGLYDVLVIDAFSDDKIPVHLLTLQAFELYLAHLRSPQSILAVHITNRYLDLAPVVLRLAAALRMSAMEVVSNGSNDFGGSPSLWVLVTKDSSVFHSSVFAHSNSAPPEKPGPLWTDDYTSLFPVLNLPY